MNISPDDPRLTAYALGEIDNPEEAREIATAVAASSELRKAVEAIRLTAQALQEAFAAELAPEISETDKVAFYAAGRRSEQGFSGPTSRILFWPWLAAAAAVVMGGFILAPAFLSVVREDERHAVASEEEIELRGKMGDYRFAPKPESADMETFGRMEEAASAPFSEPRALAARESPPRRPAPALPPPPLHMSDRADDSRSFLFVEADKSDQGVSLAGMVFHSPLVVPVSRISLATRSDIESYEQIRSVLADGRLPSADAVPIEGWINYFASEDTAPSERSGEGKPLSLHLEQAAAPWAPGHGLLRVSIQGDLAGADGGAEVHLEFSSAKVASYRLLGYEPSPSGEKRPGNWSESHGAGQSLVLFYEIVPAEERAGLVRLGTQTARLMADGERQGSEIGLATVTVHFGRSGEEGTDSLVRPVPAEPLAAFEEGTAEFRFGAAVAAFGLRLRGPEHVGGLSWEEIRSLAENALGGDPKGDRARFLDLVDRMAKLAGNDY